VDACTVPTPFSWAFARNFGHGLDGARGTVGAAGGGVGARAGAEDDEQPASAARETTARAVRARRTGRGRAIGRGIMGA
jgi:hypothetical protein